MSEFYPPRLNPVFVRLCQSISPLVGHWHYQMDLKMESSCLEKVANLRDRRLLFVSNHPTYYDWIAVFLLSARLGEVFHYLAAHERFKGTEGHFLQRMGAYSVRRGLADRSSVAQTMELLMQPTCRLVIFPEGGCSFQNDTVMPFRVGAVQIALQVMAKFIKRDEPLPDLYVVPLSLKYRYTEDMTQIIHKTLSRLEKALQISAQPSFYERLRAISEQILVGFEQDYGLYSAEIAQQSWNQRIPRLKAHILENCEQKLAIVSTPNTRDRERVYKIQHVLESWSQMATDDIWTLDTIQKAMARLLNFDAIYDGYVAAAPTPERFLNTLTRLEHEVFGDKRLSKGHQRVTIRIGEPVNLKDHFDRYQQDRLNTVNDLVQQLHQTVHSNLELLLTGDAK